MLARLKVRQGQVQRLHLLQTQLRLSDKLESSTTSSAAASDVAADAFDTVCCSLSSDDDDSGGGGGGANSDVEANDTRRARFEALIVRAG